MTCGTHMVHINDIVHDRCSTAKNEGCAEHWIEGTNACRTNIAPGRFHSNSYGDGMMATPFASASQIVSPQTRRNLLQAREKRE